MGHDHNTTFKYVLDGLSYVAIAGVLMSLLPPIASLFTIVWLGICIWESSTVRGLTGRNKPYVGNENLQSKDK